MTHPTLDEENYLRNKGYKYIAGVDEVGRGCFAGPVVAAAVILPFEFNATNEINDSKLLKPNKRKLLAKIIEKYALSYSVAEISVAVIDQIGIVNATQKAFYLAIKTLYKTPDFILIDAFYIDNLDKNSQKAIIHGDGKSISIAAASIIAKVYRDELMEKLHSKYPQYDFRQNKGYGTKKHRDAIKEHGLCDLHRKSFNLSTFIRTS
jgi:ribonuclease HII